MRRRNIEHTQEDASLLAGWMYSDLLLALMVIFLATISFVPATNYFSSSLVKVAYKQTNKALNYNRGITLIYRNFNPIALEKDIAALKVREGIEKSSDIIFVQILGGYDKKMESQDIGRNRALLFSFKLTQESNSPFTHSSITADGDSNLNPNEIGLRLTFASTIKK